MMMYDPQYKLSRHFMLSELTRTDHRDFIDINHGEAMKYYTNLVNLCELVLEPIREITGAIIINSGFRCRKVNELIGGSPTSQHMLGEAADTTYTNGFPLNEVYNEIAWAKIPFSQIILEFGQWIHVGLIDMENFPNRSGQRLIATRINGVTVYNNVIRPL